MRQFFVIIGSVGYRGNEVEQAARDAIMERVRALVRSDFLIIVNYNRNRITHNAPHINGAFMETGRDHDDGYTREGLIQIESTLRWSESNLRFPQVNCLEGYNVAGEPPDTPMGFRWMRLFTTMGLTVSDGVVLFRTHDGMGYDHHWYEFYNADLGRPVGPTAQSYNGVDGLFIRAFTKGWAVYNRSGAEQEVTLPRVASGVSSGSVATTHRLGDLDGEIYLRSPLVWDVNRDGLVNVLDLVAVAHHLSVE